MVQEDLSFLGELAFFGPVELVDCSHIALITFFICFVKDDDIKFLIQKVVCLMKNKDKRERLVRHSRRSDERKHISWYTYKINLQILLQVGLAVDCSLQ